MTSRRATPGDWRGYARLVLALLGAVALMLPAVAQAPGDLRLALVIGNSAYPGDGALPNASNDAVAMADTLRQLGFQVVELRDANRSQMSDAITKVRAALQGKQGIGLLYYAGHGLQLDWRNYMVPVDARIAASADIPAQAVDVGVVMDAFKVAGNRMNIVVLDACSDNPFAGTASGKGLAQLEAPPGTFLAFATAPGNVAIDGGKRTGHGLYTGFLLEELKKPAARIEDVFKRVRLNVRKESRGRQVPWESTSLEDDFVFNAGVKIAPRPEVADRDSAFAQQKADWDRIKDSRNADDFFAFLGKYPSGLISDLAQTRLNALQQVAIVAAPARDGRVSAAPINQHLPGDQYEFVWKDGLTGLVTQRASAGVTEVGPDLFEAKGQNTPTTVASAAGFVYRDANGSYDPPWNVIPGGELVVGNRSVARSIRTSPNGERIWVDVESRIVAQERITTALGALDTFRVEVQFIGQPGFRTKLTFWYEPGWGFSVLMRRESRTRAGGPDITVREVVARRRQG